jgi:hypothetical protein
MKRVDQGSHLRGESAPHQFLLPIVLFTLLTGLTEVPIISHYRGDMDPGSMAASLERWGGDSHPRLGQFAGVSIVSASLK